MFATSKLRTKFKLIKVSECFYQHQNLTLLPAPEFTAGKTYVYKYEMSIMSGLPEEGLARAKMNGSCKFLISALDKNMYTIKVSTRK